MSPITTDNAWRQVDRLDGKDLAEGEILSLRWPDGHTERATVKLDVDAPTWPGMRNDDYYPVTRAYVEATIHGAVARVYLGCDAGFEAERLPESQRAPTRGHR